MSEEKDLLQSKSFWGALLLVVAMVMNQFGVQIDASGWTEDIMAVIGAVLAIIGRVKAHRQIATVFGLRVKGD